jgi:anti-sigma B factor antagonist
MTPRCWCSAARHSSVAGSAPLGTLAMLGSWRWAASDRGDNVTADATEFTLHFDADRGTPTLVVTGDLDLATAADLRTRIGSVIEHSDGDLVLDMRNVTYIDSSGLSVVLDAREQLNRRQRTLIVGDPSDSVTTILAICGLAERITVSVSGSGSDDPTPDADD